MECSVCHSTNLVKVSLAYEQGLSDYQGQSRSRGLFAGTEGLGLWGGRTTSAGTSQTRLSARLSPPTKWSYWTTLKMWFAGLLVLWFVGIAEMPTSPQGAHEFSRVCAWTAEGYAGILLLLWCFIWRYNHGVFPGRRKRWDRSFMCRRCGNTILVGS